MAVGAGRCSWFQRWDVLVALAGRPLVLPAFLPAPSTFRPLMRVGARCVLVAELMAGQSQ